MLHIEKNYLLSEKTNFQHPLDKIVPKGGHFIFVTLMGWIRFKYYTTIWRKRKENDKCQDQI